jgi:hypothetical protein
MYRTAFVLFASLGLAAICGEAWGGDGNGCSAQSGGSPANAAAPTRAVAGTSGPNYAPDTMRGDAVMLPLEDVSDRHFLIYSQLKENS